MVIKFQAGKTILEDTLPVVRGLFHPDASAVEHGAVLVTGDPEFRAVEPLVTIAWV